MLSPQTIQVNIQHILGHHFSRLTNLPLCDDYIRRRAQARKGKGGEDKGREEVERVGRGGTREGRGRTREGRRWRRWGEEDKGRKEVERVGRGGQGKEGGEEGGEGRDKGREREDKGGKKKQSRERRIRRGS